MPGKEQEREVGQRSSRGILQRDIAFKKHRRRRLPSPWERFDCLVVCLNLFGMQITRR
jgi:hypothetical protein